MRYFRRQDRYAPPPYFGVAVIAVLLLIAAGLTLAVYNGKRDVKLSLCQLVSLIQCAQMDPRDVPMLPAKQ